MDGVLLKIAFRNLKEHKSKTLIIGALIMFGIAVLVVGNSFMDTVSAGIEKNYIENYTGNIFIGSSELENPALIVSNELFESAPKIIPEFERVRDHVQSLPGVEEVSGQINGVASIKWGELGEGFAFLFGVDPEEYQQMFPNGVKLESGEFLQGDEEGIVLSRTVADMINETAKDEIAPGDKVVLTTINTVSGTKIREVTVRGIHDYGEAAFDLSFISFIDQANLRIMNGMVLNTAEALALSSDEQAVLGSLDEDDLFGDSDGGLFGGDLIADVQLQEDISISTEDDFLGILGDTSVRAFLSETDPNAWNYLLVKLQDGSMSDRVVKDLNAYFAAEGIDARAWDWLEGAGMSAQLADTLSVVFNVLIFIVAIVAVIIIMNTLVISVSERYGEIGTMRAIGAKKHFVRKMISLETLMITIVFGALGVILGVIILLIMGAIGIEATNQFLQILLGGDVFRPQVSGSAIIWSMLMVSIVGVIASLYPVSVALKISPLEAMNKG
jgi:putative ABC transport system permease protein